LNLDESISDYRHGELATNEGMVKRIARLSRDLGREIANPDEARQILGTASA